MFVFSFCCIIQFLVYIFQLFTVFKSCILFFLCLYSVSGVCNQFLVYNLQSFFIVSDSFIKFLWYMYSISVVFIKFLVYIFQSLFIDPDICIKFLVYVFNFCCFHSVSSIHFRILVYRFWWLHTVSLLIHSFLWLQSVSDVCIMYLDSGVCI